jgi:predicted glycosyltransferase
MIREAAVLGTPTWSIFEGRRGAVDEQLEREGRIRFLGDPEELVVEKVAQRKRRAARDPADLLALAIPSLPGGSRTVGA